MSRERFLGAIVQSPSLLFGLGGIMRGSDYAELRAFVMIVEHGNFARAAAQLRISPSTLSQTIRKLEERLGVRLLNRTTRSVSLTDAGTRLLSRLKPALDEMDAAIDDVNEMRNAPAGTLRLHAPRQAAAVFIEPFLGQFHEAFPHIVLDVTLDDTMINIVEAGFDMGIRLGETLEHDMVAVELGGNLREIAVASPAYLATHGHPGTPSDLHAHHCINWRQPRSGALYNWRFNKNREWFEVSVKGPLIVSHRDLALSAAVQGVGIAFGISRRAQSLIEQGKLVSLLEEWCPPFPGWHLYYPKQRYTPATVRALVGFLRHSLAQSHSTPAAALAAAKK
jgi:DNA-binding transcriptional LysR family regulator